jgi:hypothetical protein
VDAKERDCWSCRDLLAIYEYERGPVQSWQGIPGAAYLQNVCE